MAALPPPLQSTAKKQIFLLTFISKIEERLGTAKKVQKGVDRLSKRKSTNDFPAAKHKSSQPLPCNEAGFYGMHH